VNTMNASVHGARILVVDDDPNICEVLRLYLSREGFETHFARDGQEALAAYAALSPDLVILDIMLPRLDGWDVCRRIRQQGSTPIIMLTAIGESTDRVAGLELGADDYVVKPFDPNELVARVKAVLRRTLAADRSETGRLEVSGLEIDRERYEVRLHGELLDLAPKELELLYYLASHPNRVFTRDQLLEAVWGYDYVGQSRTVDVHIQRLRKKLGLSDPAAKDRPWDITTVWGVGYKFEVKD